MYLLKWICRINARLGGKNSIPHSPLLSELQKTRFMLVGGWLFVAGSHINFVHAARSSSELSQSFISCWAWNNCVDNVDIWPLHRAGRHASGLWCDHCALNVWNQHLSRHLSGVGTDVQSPRTEIINDLCDMMKVHNPLSISHTYLRCFK